MSESKDQTVASAEQAYATAAEAVPVKPAEAAPTPELPTPESKAKAVDPKPEPVKAPVKAKGPAKKPIGAKKVPAPKAKAAAKPVKTPAKVKAANAPKTADKPIKPAAKPAAVKNANPKETRPMAKTTDFIAPMTELLADMQERAKAAYEKSTAMASEMGEFAKGNLEAVTESGKIVSGAMQDLGKTAVSEAKGAFETLTADMKDFAAVKSPTELFQLQSKLARRNFDALAAYGSKSSETMVKLASDAMAPISARVSLAAELASKSA